MARKKESTVSIVIPCLNEQETISHAVTNGLQSLKLANVKGEVLVSDNGSTDKSISLARKAGARVVKCKVKGYGAALKFGFSHAKGDWLCMGDADGSYDFSILPAFITKLKKGYSVVIGNRLGGTIDANAMPALHRYLGTPVLTKMLNFFFHAHFNDCNSGLRALTKQAFQTMRLESDGMEFATEMLVKTAILKIPYAEIPIHYRKDLRSHQRPHLHTFRDGWRHLKFLLIYAPDKVFTLPGIICFFIGSLLVFSQINGALYFGRYHLDFHFMILGMFIGLFGTVLIQMGIGLELLSEKKGYRVGSLGIWTASFFKLERLLIIGGLLFLAGFGIDFLILLQWIGDHFSRVVFFRQALVASYVMIIGIEVIFYAIFYTILSQITISES